MFKIFNFGIVVAISVSLTACGGSPSGKQILSGACQLDIAKDSNTKTIEDIATKAVEKDDSLMPALEAWEKYTSLRIVSSANTKLDLVSQKDQLMLLGTWFAYCKFASQS